MIPVLLAVLAASPTPVDQAAVMLPIDGIFAGLAVRDGQKILDFVRPEGSANVAAVKADGTHSLRHESWSEFASGLKPGPERYEERLIDPEVRIDGDIAMVWGHYIFSINGKTHHCGVDHFDLLREGRIWKVLNVTWSSRVTGC
jgi:hypothetical protein